MPSVTERPVPAEGTIVAQPGPALKTTVFSVEWPLTSRAALRASPGVPPFPLRYGGTNEQPTTIFLKPLSCCHCQAQYLQGQRICFKCGGHVKPDQLKSQGRRTTLARGREALLITEAAARQGSREPAPQSVERCHRTKHDFCCVRGCSQGENGAEESHP